MVLLRYPGTKAALERQIPERYFSCWCEPFVGAGGMALGMASRGLMVGRFILGDADLALMALWRCVLEDNRQFGRMIRSFKPSLYAWDCQRATLEDSDAFGVELGFAKLAVHQMSYSGLGEKAGGPIGGADQNGKEWDVGCRWSVDALERKFQAIRRLLAGRTELVWGDWGDTLREAGDDATLYIDPPYFKVGIDLYREVVDHEDLARHLEQEEREWWLSYNDCDEVRDLYGFAQIDEVELRYMLAKKQKQAKQRELLIRPSGVISPRYDSGVAPPEKRADIPR